LIYSGTPKTHTATSPGISGFTFSYSGVNATAYGPSPVAPTNVGDYQVTAMSSDPSWSGSKTQAFSIAPASLGAPDIISLNPSSSLEYSRTPKTRTATVEGISNLTYSYAGVSPTVYGPTGTAPTNVGTYAVTVTATSADGNYATSKTFSFGITPKPVSVTANAATKFFGSTDPVFTYAVSGLIAPDELTGALSRAAGENVGTYNILVGTLSAGPNYTLSFTGATLTIGGAPIFSILAPTSLTYDGTPKPFTAAPYQVRAIAAGPNRTLAVLTNGGVVSWGKILAGSGYNIELVPPDLTNAVAVAAGQSFSLALRSDGTLRAWGMEGISTRALSVLNPPANDGSWSSYQRPFFESYDRIDEISAGTLHAVALKKRDSYDTPKTWAWGIGGNGATGKDANGYYTYSGFTNTLGYSEGFGWRNVKAIAAGFWYTLVVREDGSVQAYGDVTNLAPPADLTNAIAVAAGFQHALAIRTNGTVVAWGNNLSGQTNVPAGLSGVIAVAGGRDHSLALRTNGTVVAWGGNAEGQASVPAGLTNVTAIAAGDFHSVALKSDGTVVAWGGNSSGQRNVPAALQPGTPVFTFSYAGRGTTVYGPSATPPSQGGTYTVTVTSSSSDPSMNFASTGSRDFTIEGAPLSSESISIGPLSRDYDGTGQGVTATAPGVSCFTYSYAGVSPTVYPASSTPPTQAGSYQVTATSSDPNWSGSKTQSFTILPAALYDGNLTLTAPADLEYSGTPKEFTAGGASLLRVTYSGIGSTDYPSSSSAPTQAGTYSVTVRTPTDDPNYERAKRAIFSITPRPVTITAQSRSKAYGAPDPALTYLKSGFLGSDQPTGSLSREAGESLGTYAIVQGTLSPGPNYILQSFTGATFTITGVNSLAPGSIPFFSGVDKLMNVPILRSIGGLAFSGENKLFVHGLQDPRNFLISYQFTGTNLVTSAVVERARDYGQLACSGDRLFGRSGGQLYLINPALDRSDQLVTVDPNYPLLGDGGSLFNLPDGQLGVVGEVTGGQFTVRLYTVSADGLTLTWSQDFTLYDSWNPAGAGFGCDGTYFYKLSRSEGYKSYTLATGQVAFDGTYWRPPVGFNISDNPTYMARNHLTGQFMIADIIMIADVYYPQRVLVSVNLEADTRLTAPTSLVYNGNPKSYTVAGSWLQAVYEGRGSTTYGPTTNAPVGTGAYRVKVAAKDANFELGNVNVADFTITPATMGLGLTPPASLVYDGNPKAYTASAANPAAGTFIYTYAGRGDTFYGPSAIAPNNVGTYRVSATTANAANFTDGLLESDFAITPATLSLAPPTSFAYSGTAKSYTTTLPFISGVTFSYSGRESTIYGPTTVAPTAPGTYRVTATVPSSGNYLISESLTADFAITSITVGSTPWAPLQVSSDTVLPLAGSATIAGLACDGTNYFVNRGGTAVMVYRPDGSMISSNPVSNLRADNNQMAFAGGYLFARKDSQLYRISTNDWSSSLVTVDASYPLLSAGSYMTGSLFDTPDGKLGVMGPVIGGAFKVRMYTVSSNGLTLTWNRDYTVNDTWAPDEHGTACDGTFLYRMSMTTGYKAYRLATGTVAYDGTGWTKPSAIVNPTFVARNHRTGQILVGDYRGSRLIVSSASPQLGLLAPASLVFDGNPKECEVARIGSLDYTFTYRGANLTAYGPSSTAPVNAGDYLFTVTAPDSAYIAPDPLAFTIQPAAILSTNIILTAPSLIYNGDGKAYTASAPGVTGFTYTYTGRAGTSYGPSTVAPTDAGSYTVTASVNDANYTGTKSLDFAIAKATPTITSIPTTSAISYGQSLTSSSLSSGTASVPGVFAFNTPNTTPSAGTSNHTVTFTPADTVNYNPVSCTVEVTVNPGVLNSSNIAFTAPANLVYSGTQKAFTATAPGISTDFAYSYSDIGGTSYGPTSTPPTNPGNYAVTATVMNANYTGSATQTFTITKATPSITWATPASIRDGTALSASQLNATASVAGSFVYSPASGTTLATGAHTLQASFTPTDTANYNSASASVSLLVYSPSPSFSLIAPPSLTYDGTAKTYAVSQMSRIAAGLAHSLAIKADGTVVAWGSNSDGQTSVPANLSGVIQVAAGYYHSLALKADGSVVGWGANNENQRANIQGSFAPFTGYSSLSPLVFEPPAPAISNGIAVAGGGRLSLVLKVDGTVAAIGKKDSGSAMPTTQDHALTVPAGLIGVTAIAAGWDHALALKSDGTVVAWDGNQHGESTVPDGLSGVVAIAAGQDHSIALKSDGTVVAWGRNNLGQCTVPSSVANVVAITCGDYESYALKRDGSVLYWGSLGSGQAVSSGSGVIAISAGGAHLLMLKSDGSLAAWGSNNSGQASIPAAVATGVGNFAYSYSYTGRAGTVYAANSTAPVNPGSYRLTVTSTNPNFSESKTVDFTIAKATPTLITQPMASIITEGQALSAASISGGSASVNGTFSFSAPTFVPQAGANTQSITFTPTDSVNYNAVTTNVTVLVQGANAATPTINSMPSASAINLGQQLASSILSGGSASVPGTFVFSSRFASPNPGPASQSVTFIPTDIANYKAVSFAVPVTVYDGIVSPLNIALIPPPSMFYDAKAKPFFVSKAQFISMGKYHWTAVKSDGTVDARGLNDLGQTTVPVGLSGVVAIDSGGDMNLALKSDGTVAAWGTAYGARSVPAGLTNAVAVSTGGSHSLALKSDGTVTAWGDNTHGETSVPVGLNNLVAVSAGTRHSLALKSDGTVAAWGFQSTVPPGLSGVIAISAGQDNSLALKSDGTVVAWGDNGYGKSTVPEGLANVVGISAGRYHSVALKSDGTVVAWGNQCVFDPNGPEINLVPSTLVGVVAVSAGNDETSAMKSDGSVVRWGHSFEQGPYRVNGQVYFLNGSAFSVPFATPVPDLQAGFDFTCSYAGRDGTYPSSTTAPTNPGNYRITATGTDPDFPAAKTLDFTIQKGIPTILNIPNPSLITFGQSLSNSTLDGGIASVAGTFAWTNPATAPNAGTASHAFTFTPDDTTNYQATTGTVSVTVHKALASITLGNLNASYDGTAKSASVSTTPEGLTTILTYNGESTAPTDVGTYEVVATIDDANFTGTKSELLTIAQTRLFGIGGDPLGQMTSSVITLSGDPSIWGIACDGTRIYVNSSSSEIRVYDLNGTLLESHAVENLPPLGNNQMAFAGGHLFARSDDTLYRISTTNWSSTPVEVDSSHPLLTCAWWMYGSLFDTPDGKLGVMGPTNDGQFTVRLYQVSSDGLTLTWERDQVINDTWSTDEHGMACDGVYFYRMSMLDGCKVYDLATGEIVHGGEGWNLWSAADGGTIHNPTWLTRNHRTGQLIAGEYQADQLLVFTPDDGINFTAPQSMIYDGSGKVFSASSTVPCTFEYTYKGIGTTSYGPSTEAPKNAGNYVVTARSTDSSLEGSSSLPFTIVPKTLTVTSDAKTKLYGAVDPALTYQSSGLVGEDEITGSLNRAPGENAGSYSILQGSITAGANYAISYIGADLVVEKAPIAPTNFLAAQTTNLTADLSWTPDSTQNSACTGFKISHKPSASDTWTENTVGADATTYSVSSLLPGTVYNFRIAALNGTDSSSEVTTTLTTWTSHEEWRFTNFGTIANAGNAADSANPSKDGMQNLMKYALGLSANARSNQASLNTQMNANGRLALTFMRARGDLTYTVQGSNDLVTWSDLEVNPGTIGEAVTVTDTAPTSAKKRFIRLKVAR
jgi:alpha-tubulin suppressor-like RCC1 family protein